MDRKVFLALVLSAVVLVVFQVLFPPPKPTPRQGAATTATATGTASATGSATTAEAVPGTTPGTPGAPALDSMAKVATGQPLTAPAETTVVETAKVRYRVSSLGARPIGAELRDYNAMGANGKRTTRPVELLRAGDAIVGYRLVVPGDTLDLSRVPFSRVAGTAANGASAQRLEYRATLPNGIAVAIAYTFSPD